MARKHSWKIIRQVSLTRADVVSRDVPTYSVQAMRNLLAYHAIRFYGEEGRAWRMVHDQTVIGFHVKALHPCEGETLTIE
jgi:hypothetical protein